MTNLMNALYYRWVVTVFVAVVGSVPAWSAERVQDGLVAGYDFSSVRGDQIPDQSTDEIPLHLKIKTPKKATVAEGVLKLQRDAMILGSPSASKLLSQRIEKSQEITIELWMRSTKLDQTGPARIVSLSRDTTNRNVTLGQEKDAIEVRFRTTSTGKNGLPGTKAEKQKFVDKWTHVVYVRRKNADAQLFVDGKPQADSSHKGKVDGWDAMACQLLIGNELGGGRGWQGELDLVAIYDRALKKSEIRQNRAAGRQAFVGISPKALKKQQALAKVDQAAQHFESHIAPLLSRHCLECHDASVRKGDLDLSRKSVAFKGGDSGAAIVPGDPEESLVWTSVIDDEMPHDRDPLSDDEKDLLKQWIKDGAVWSLDYVDPAVYRHESTDQRWIARLTVPQYVRTVQALFGIDVSAEAKTMLPSELRADGFANTSYNLTVDLDHITAYAKLADLIVDRTNVGEFSKPFAADRTHTDRNMRPLVEKMGTLVLRGPLTGEEIALYRGIASTAALAGASFEEAVGYVLRAMLQSPRFIYRIEQPFDSVWDRDPHQVANRISYTVWGAPPDELLRDAAEYGDLNDPAAIRQHVERMWDDPRSVDRSIDFVTQWLDLDRMNHLQPSKERFPDWSRELAADMKRETIEVFRDAVWEQNLPLVRLLDTPFTYATPRLAKHYGVDPKSKPWAKYELSEDSERSGILTHGSILTIGGDNASMVTRGLFVLNDLLFSEVGDPPPGLDTTPVPTKPGLTHRMVAEERVASESCGGCHRRFEPLAYGLERFDGVGKYSATDEFGNKLREDGKILFPGVPEASEFESTIELVKLLAESDRVAECLTRKVIQFAVGRPLQATDARAVRSIFQAAGGKNATYQSIISETLASSHSW